MASVNALPGFQALHVKISQNHPKNVRRIAATEAYVKMESVCVLKAIQERIAQKLPDSARITLALEEVYVHLVSVFVSREPMAQTVKSPAALLVRREKVFAFLGDATVSQASQVSRAHRK